MLVWILLCSSQCRRDLCRMVCIIVHDSHSVERSLQLETALGSFESKKSLPNGIHINVVILCQRDGGQCIGNVVATDHMQVDVRLLCAVADQVEVTVAVLVEADIICEVITFLCQTEGDHRAVKIVGNLAKCRDLAVNDQHTV